MRKFFPVVISGLMTVSFSQFAAAQSAGVQGPAGTGATVDLNKGGTTVSPDVQNNQQLGSRNQANQQQGASDDKNPDSPGKGWAKGKEQGKGNPHGSASGGSSYDRDADRRDRERQSSEQSSTQEQNKKD